MNRFKDESEYTPDISHDTRDFFEPVYTIGVAAAKLGVSVHTLRLYETEGLIITYKTSTEEGCIQTLNLKKSNA